MLGLKERYKIRGNYYLYSPAAYTVRCWVRQTTSSTLKIQFYFSLRNQKSPARRTNVLNYFRNWIFWPQLCVINTLCHHALWKTQRVVWFHSTLVSHHACETELHHGTSHPGDSLSWQDASYQAQGLFWWVVAAEDTRVPPVKKALSRKHAGLSSTGYAWAQAFPWVLRMISSLCFCLCSAFSRDVFFSAVVIKH